MSGSDATLADRLRQARRRWASGVAVVACREGDGVRGATVSAFTVVSLDPPLVLVCLDRDGRMASLVPEQGAFAVSVLERGDEFAAERFAGRAPLPDVLWTGIAHRRTGGGPPVLRDALVWFDCRVTANYDGGDHLIVVGRVEDVGEGGDAEDPLVVYDGAYWRIDRAGSAGRGRG